MPTLKESRFGELAPQYGFVMNPYPNFRASSRPGCNHPNAQRKVPLLIHIDPRHLIALNYTCRYCPRCDLLLAHKHELEHILHDLFSQLDPQAIGNEYLVIGTVEKKAWRKGLKHPQPPAEILPHTHDFRSVYPDLRVTQGGWFPRDVTPPVAQPPESQEWVKAK